MRTASKRRRQRFGSPIPTEVDMLRDAVKVLDPYQTFHLVLPDGSTFTTTGAEMIETADAYIALADAQRARNWRGMVKALARIGGLP